MIYGNEFILCGLWVISGKLSSEEKKKEFMFLDINIFWPFSKSF